MVGELTPESREKISKESPIVIENQVARFNTTSSRTKASPAALNASRVWGDSCDDPHAGDPVSDEEDARHHQHEHEEGESSCSNGCGTCGTDSSSSSTGGGCGAENCDCESTSEAPPPKKGKSTSVKSTVATHNTISKVLSTLPNFDGPAAAPFADIAAATTSPSSPYRGLPAQTVLAAILAVLASLVLFELLP